MGVFLCAFYCLLLYASVVLLEPHILASCLLGLDAFLALYHSLAKRQKCTSVIKGSNNSISSVRLKKTSCMLGTALGVLEAFYMTYVVI